MFVIIFETINVQRYVRLKIHREFKLTTYNMQCIELRNGVRCDGWRKKNERIMNVLY